MAPEKMLTSVLFLLCGFFTLSESRSFTIDYERDVFLKDGKPFRYVSGSIHYFRVPHELWLDRLQTMRAAGLNAIQTYIEWSTHEPLNGQFSFEGQNDIVKFIRTAESVGFLVLLRLGPFIDAERDMGGFPFWLMSNNTDIKLRTSSKSYLQYVDRYYSKLLPLLKPLLYSNGGPVIMLQVENEYGSYPACDFKYTAHLRDVVRSYVGDDVILYSTDGDSDSLVKCGKNEGVYTTVDFGPATDVIEAYAVQRRHQLRGPLVNSEYYPGWLDVWGQPHVQVPSVLVALTLEAMLRRNASVNVYMFHGGTSFGFTSGAIMSGGKYQPCVTSYDYDAPMTEAGDPTPKYFLMRKVISQFLPLPHMPEPRPKPKISLGPVEFTYVLSLPLIIRETGDTSIPSKHPLSFEDVGHGHGLMVYMTNVTFRARYPAVLKVPGLRDRGYVYVDGVYKGMLSHMDNVYEMLLPVKRGSALWILVENQGRVSVGPEILGRKGIIGDVTLGSQVLTDWAMLPMLQPDYSSLIKRVNVTAASNNLQNREGFGIYFADFELAHPEPLDTFMRLDGWRKGFVYLNGHPLGRYWPERGPQVTLYVPYVYLKRNNKLIVVEQEEAPCGTSGTCTVSFVSEPQINGTVPEGEEQRANVELNSPRMFKH
ncbi:beta-galactosidase-like [Ornithodoros turicata]|uniref:beta-galactosidase-like n=1 Tax=Ornithodoros turicata TaxID=34597 RepID=UPI00313A1BCC